MTKIYGIYGYRNASIKLPIGTGGAYLDLEFTKGNPQPGNYYRPATYVSTSKVEQQMIEKSALFGKSIIIYRSFGDEEPQAGMEAEDMVMPADPIEPVKEDWKIYDDVSSIEMVRTVLKTLGAKALVLKDEQAMKDFMAKKKVKFPNFAF